MIKIKDCDGFDLGELLATSAREFASTDGQLRERLLRMSAASKVIEDEEGPLLVAGIIKPTLLSAPHLWVLLGARFRARPSTLRALYELLQDAHGLETYIEKGNIEAENLAEFFGFTPTNEQRVLGHVLFRLYRRA